MPVAKPKTVPLEPLWPERPYPGIGCPVARCDWADRVDDDAWTAASWAKHKQEQLLRGLLARYAGHWQQDHTSPHDQLALL